MLTWPRIALWSVQGAWIRFHARFLCRHRRIRHWRPNGEVFRLRCGLSWRRDPTNPNILESKRGGAA